MIFELLLMLQSAVFLAYSFPLARATSTGNSTASEVSWSMLDTLKNPSDTLTVLLIIPGDIVLKALAQLSGRHLAPVAFSFGWVTYSFNTVVSMFGDGRLLPPPEYPVKVLNLRTGNTRDNQSWVIGRLLRDFHWFRPVRVEASEGLCITVFQASNRDQFLRPGMPALDWYWWGGLATILIQLGIAAIPCALYGDWGILAITFVGNVLSLATGALPQWRAEKWACRRDTKKVLCLTSVNDMLSPMVIFGSGIGLDLEDLTAARSPMVHHRGSILHASIFGLPKAFVFTQVSCLLLASLWILFLIIVTGIDQSAWYLLLVGGLGMLQNAVVAGATRPTLSTSGIHIEEVEEFNTAGKTMMNTIMDFESAYPGLGKPFLDEVFPLNLRTQERKWWEGDKAEYNESREVIYPQKEAVVLSDRAMQLRQRYREEGW